MRKAEAPRPWLRATARPKEAARHRAEAAVGRDEPMLRIPTSARLRQAFPLRAEDAADLRSEHLHHPASCRRRHAWTLLRRPNPCRRTCSVAQRRRDPPAEPSAWASAQASHRAAAEAEPMPPEAEAEPRHHSWAAASARTRAVVEAEAMKHLHQAAVEAAHRDAFACPPAAATSLAAAGAELHLPAAGAKGSAQCRPSACLYEFHLTAEEPLIPASSREDPSWLGPRRRPNRCCPYHRPCSATPQEIAVLTANDGTHPSHTSLHASRGSSQFAKLGRTAHAQRKKLTPRDYSGLETFASLLRSLHPPCRRFGPHKEVHPTPAHRKRRTGNPHAFSFPPHLRPRLLRFSAS